MNIKIRTATIDDIPQLAPLCQQLLGQPIEIPDLASRVELINQDPQHAVFVAEDISGQIVGWLHVHISLLLHMERQAELGGFVVDQNVRNQGIGKLLIARAEEWAREHHCHYVYLRSRTSRNDAHAFYERRGYRNIKVQYAFRKQLN